LNRVGTVKENAKGSVAQRSDHAYLVMKNLLHKF